MHVIDGQLLAVATERAAGVHPLERPPAPGPVVVDGEDGLPVRMSANLDRER